jgi:hypothetical protein
MTNGEIVLRRVGMNCLTIMFSGELWYYQGASIMQNKTEFSVLISVVVKIIIMKSELKTYTHMSMSRLCNI